MTSLWSRVVTGGASFFSRSAEENEVEEKKKKKTASFGDATHAAAILLSATSSPWWVLVVCASEAVRSATAVELQNLRFCFFLCSSRISARGWSARCFWVVFWHWSVSGCAGLGSGSWSWLDSWWELFSTRIWRLTLQLVPKCVIWLFHDSALHGATEVGRMMLRSNCCYWNDGPDVLNWCSTVLTMCSTSREANLWGQTCFSWSMISDLTFCFWILVPVLWNLVLCVKRGHNDSLQCSTGFAKRKNIESKKLNIELLFFSAKMWNSRFSSMHRSRGSDWGVFLWRIANQTQFIFLERFFPDGGSICFGFSQSSLVISQSRIKKWLVVLTAVLT